MFRWRFSGDAHVSIASITLASRPSCFLHALKRCSHFRYLSSSPLSFDPQTELYYPNDLYGPHIVGASRSAPVALATPPPRSHLYHHRCRCIHDRFLPKRGRVFCPSSHAPSTFIVEDWYIAVTRFSFILVFYPRQTIILPEFLSFPSTD